MAIYICPACGTNLQIPPELVGKKVKCTKCQHIFLAAAAPASTTPPAPVPPPAQVPPPAPVPPPAAAPRPTSAMKPGSAPAPKPAPPGNQPPRKATSGMAPAQAGQPQRKATSGLGPTNGGPPRPAQQRPPQQQPRPAAARRRNDDDDDEYEEKKGGAGKLILAVSGLLVVAALAVGAIFFFNPFGGGNGDNNNNNGGGGNNIVKVDHTTDHKFLPDDADVVVSVKVAQVLNSQVVNDLRKEIPPVGMALSQLKDIRQQVGVDAEDVETLTVGINSMTKNGVGVIGTKKEYTVDELLKNMNRQGQAAPLIEGSYKIYRVGDKDKKDAFCVVDKKQILFGSSKALHEILKRNAAPAFSKELQAAIKSVDFSNILVAAADFKELKKTVPGQQPGGQPNNGNRNQPPPGAVEPVLVYPDVPEYGGVEVSTIGNQVAIKGYAFYKDAKPATDTAKLINDGVTMIKMQNAFPASLRDLLTNMQVSAQDTKLTAQATITTTDIVALVKDVSKGTMPQLPPEILAKLGMGGPPQPPLPPASVQLTVGKPHNFILGQGGLPQEFMVFCKGDIHHNLSVKTNGPSRLVINVLDSGKVVSFSGGADASTEHKLSWSLKGGNFLQIKVQNFDPLPHQCEILVKEETSAPPKPEIVVKKDGPFNDLNKTFNPGDKVVYQFPAKAGDPATFRLQTPPGGAQFEVKVLQDGKVVQQDAGKKENFKLEWKPDLPGQYAVELVYQEKTEGKFDVSFAQADSKPPVVTPIAKSGPFNETMILKPGEKVAFEIQVQPDKLSSFTVTSVNDAKLDMQVTQKGKMLASDNGQKKSFNLAFTPSNQGSVLVQVINNDTSRIECNFAFKQEAGTPVVDIPGAVKKDGPFKEKVKFKKDEEVVYQFPAKGGQEAYLRIDTAGAATVMVVKVMQNGTKLAEEPGQILRNMFLHKWTPSSDGLVAVYITAKENQTYAWEVEFTQGLTTSLPGAIVKAGPFSESLKIKPKDKITFEVPVKGGQPATFSLKPVVDINAEIKVTQNGTMVAQDSGTKTSFDLNWTPSAAGKALIEIVSTDEFISSCTASLSQKAGAPVEEVVGNLIGQPSPFMADFTIGANDKFTFKFPVEANREATFQIKGKDQNVDMDVKIYQKGNLVASKSGAFREANMTWTPTESSFAFAQFNVSANNQEKKVFFGFIQSGDLPPPLGNLTKKDGPFTWDSKISPGDKFSIQVPVKAGGQATFRYKTKSGTANLDMKVYHAEKLVAQKEGFHNEFELKWNPVKAGDVMLQVACNDTRNLDGTFSFTQEGGTADPVPPVGGNVIKKAGPFTQEVNFKPNETVNFEFPVQPGQSKIEIKPVFGSKLDIRVFHNGALKAQSVNEGIKTIYSFNWSSSDPGTGKMEVVCRDQFTVPATVTLSGPGDGNPPPPPPAGIILLKSPQPGVPTQSQSVIANGQPVLYKVPLQAGTKYAIKMNSPQLDSYLELMDPNGQTVAQDDDGGGFPNAKISYTPNVTGSFQIKCRPLVVGNGNGAFTLVVEQEEAVGGNPTNSVTKTAPFADIRTIKAGESMAYRVPAKLGDQFILNVSQQKVANLDIKVTASGKLLASDLGPKNIFTQNINIPKNGFCTITITNKDTQDSTSSITLGTVGGQPPPPGGGNVDFQHNGSLFVSKTTNQSKPYRKKLPLQAGVAYKISGTADFFLTLEVAENVSGNPLLKQSFPGGSGSITFTPKVTKDYYVVIRDAFNQKGGKYILTVQH